jgi:hypothetical protein
MTKYVRLPFSMRLELLSGQTVVRIALERGAVADLCLGLILIREQLTDSVLLVEARTNKKLRLELAASLKRTSVMSSAEGDRTDLALVPTDLDYLLHAFLKYYRDGAAEVDHFDLQADFGNGVDLDAYVTFVVPDSVAPLTEDEAKKRLEMD